VLLSIVIPAAVLGVFILAMILFLQRGAGAVDATPRSLLRVYLYLASLVSLIVLVFGLSQGLTGVFGMVAPDFTYGGPGAQMMRKECPPGVTGCPSPEEEERRRVDANSRRARENILEGITLASAGALFWGIHRYGRREVETTVDRVSLLARGYYVLGVAIFGIASIVLLPLGIYNALRYWLIPVGEFDFRPGAGEMLAAAIVVVPVWIAFLWIVLRDYRASPGAATVSAV
jgi:hypothetical protein